MENILNDILNLGYKKIEESKTGKIVTLKKGNVVVKVNVPINVYTIYEEREDSLKHIGTYSDIKVMKKMNLNTEVLNDEE